MESKIYSDYDQPSYNIKAVAQMLGLLPVTLRAWERRYGLPTPQRGGQGYRLYSEHDMQTLRWLKSQIDSGMNIGQAARKLTQLKETGQDPAAKEITRVDKPMSLENLRLMVLHSLHQFNDQTATEAMRQAFSLYTAEDVFSQLIAPNMVDIGNSWHKGELPIAEEHFASHFFQEQLIGLMAVAPQPYRSGLIVASCLPGEYHQLGILMVTVLLRMRGWNVLYLGPNLSLDGLAEVLIPLHPRIILFSATIPESATQAVQLPHLLSKFPAPAPQIILGGKGFSAISLPEKLPFPVYTEDPSAIVHKIEDYLETRVS